MNHISRCTCLQRNISVCFNRRRPLTYITNGHIRTTGSLQEYKRPVPLGKVPAYDLALEYLEQDSKMLREGAKELEGVEGSEFAMQKMLQEAEGNAPENRWRVKNKQIDWSNLGQRYLREREFKSEGELALAYQRITQHKIMPDLVPLQDIHANVVLEMNHKPIEHGRFLPVDQTLTGPDIKIEVFHPEERLYSLLLIDSDSPNEVTQSFSNFIHHAILNIKLSATSNNMSFENIVTDLHYIPPHPQNGTPNHRYTYILVSHPNPVESFAGKRSGLNMRKWLQSNTAKMQGLSFWRAAWQEKFVPALNKIYDIHFPDLKQPMFVAPTQNNILPAVNLENYIPKSQSEKTPRAPKTDVRSLFLQKFGDQF